MAELTIGQAMRNARKRKGITASKLSAITGYNKYTISRWENDKAVPTLISVIDIADTLGVSIDELIGHEVRKKR